ncbi:MAG: sigma 54-interacting transcriptional regulator [Deltaproteobacteria bacterium]|nr:sigma 54-interacting transcriptional regulator [Deltaproteobacteria bacterium]
MTKEPRKRAAPIFTEDATVPTTQSGDTSGTRLLIFGEGEPTSFPLLEAGTYTIGRSLDADIYVQDPSLSRLHAVLTFEPGRGFHIRDLGSSNGTRLRGARLDPEVDYAFELGEAVDLGRSTILVQRGATLERPRRVWPHSYFELRLEDLCARARSSGEQFAILRARVRTSSAPGAIEDALTSLLGPDDLIAGYAPLEYDVLLARGGPSEAEEATSAMRFGLRRLGAEVEIGIGCFPRDGREPGELIARVGAGVRGRTRAEAAAGKDSIVIEDASMRRIYELVERIAESDIGVLILGETGVGKEILAQAVHDHSRRRASPFVAINCGAFQDQLLESELFGHERGAFTGAIKAKLGLLETARGGTLFLDEVGEMSLATQVKLLRVLEERRVRKLGGLESVPFDARIIAATNRDLEAAVRQGRFREDLYYRLNGFSLVIPPLRERRGEIAPLARSFAREMARKEGSTRETSFAPAAIAALEEYAWPGNVRELKNVVERAVVLAAGDRIDTPHLPMEKLTSSVVFASPERAPPRERELRARGPAEEHPFEEADAGKLRAKLLDVERESILAALEQCGGNQTRAAELLGMSRKSLLRRLDQYDLPRPRKGRGDLDPE